jgi:hypothetical protein
MKLSAVEPNERALSSQVKVVHGHFVFDLMTLSKIMLLASIWLMDLKRGKVWIKFYYQFHKTCLHESISSSGLYYKHITIINDSASK